MDCRYITSALKPEQLPVYEHNEVAFIGRSNVGKSSLLNSVLGRRNLARHGRTPGQTQMINFFSVQDKLIFADLPGYGFSAIDKNVALKWEPLMEAYMQRPNIKEFLQMCIRDRFGAEFKLLSNLTRQMRRRRSLAIVRCHHAASVSMPAANSTSATHRNASCPNCAPANVLFR